MFCIDFILNRYIMSGFPLHSHVWHMRIKHCCLTHTQGSHMTVPPSSSSDILWQAGGHQGHSEGYHVLYSKVMWVSIRPHYYYGFSQRRGQGSTATALSEMSNSEFTKPNLTHQTLLFCSTDSKFLFSLKNKQLWCLREALNVTCVWELERRWSFQRKVSVREN